MYEVKRYDLYKTARKTASVNELETVERDKRYLFDFSLLDDFDISPSDKNIIKLYALKYVSPANRTSYYGHGFDNFHAVDGMAWYYMHKVYDNKTGHIKYWIFQLAVVKNISKRRTNVWDNYAETERLKETKYSEPREDYEV